MSTTTNEINYTKLKDGSWGLRGPGLTEGTSVRVTKRSGQTKTETVGHVVWKGNGVSVARIASRNGSSSSRRAYSRRSSAGAYGAEYCGGTCPVNGHRCGPAAGPCHDCE